MDTTRIRLLYMVVGCTIGYLPLSAPPLAAQDDCKALSKVLLEAAVKFHNNPARVYGTVRNAGGRIVNTELIYAAGSVYMNINGKWTGPTTGVEQQMEQLTRNFTARDTCRYLRDEPVNGEMAALYSVRSETPRGTHDTQIWISKSKGLLLRQDVDSDGGKTHLSSRYEYGNVKPPL